MKNNELLKKYAGYLNCYPQNLCLSPYQIQRKLQTNSQHLPQGLQSTIHT